MNKPCSYVVDYGLNERAKFSSYDHAVVFAVEMARRTGVVSELWSRRHGGLIGQYEAITGDPTAEFAHLRAA